MKKICVFASGNGSNFENLMEHTYSNAKIVCLVCDNAKAYVLTRAKKYMIKVILVNPKDYQSKEAYEKQIIRELEPFKIDYILLAGYMKIISNILLDAYPNKIINLHPALLPAFKGAHAIKDAYHFGVKVMGVTVHYIDNEIDGGIIIDQKAINIKGLTFEQVEEKIHELEYELYPKVLEEVTK